MQIQEVFDRRRFVFLDGGMGTQLQQRGLQPGQKPELAALEMPDVLTAIHRDYTAAGADILLANTFGANAKKLAGCGRSVEEVVSASIACARRAGQETSALVALDIGPLGELLALAAAALLLLAAGCNNNPAEPEPKPDPEYPVTVGNVTLTEAPTAVVSLSPATTEMVYDLGYGELLVGVSEYCTAPAAAVAKPRMGSAYQPEVEKIKASGATLVLCTVQPTESTLTELQQAGAQVLVLPRADSVEGIKQNYRALGSLLAGNVTGTAAAETVSTAIDSKLAEATAALSGMAAAPDATLLISYPYRMATGDTLEGQLLAQVGFHCSGADYTNWLYPESELRALEPDVIFCAEADEVETVKQSYEYKVVAAVKNDKVMAIDFTAFQNQSLRMFDTLAEMAKFTAAEPAEA